MKFLFVHQNFPGQFKSLAPALARQGHTVLALGLRDLDPNWEGVQYHRYFITRGNTAKQHPWVLDFESKMIRAEACLKAAQELKTQGFYPDAIIAHPGWGESLFLKELWPDSTLGIFCEFYYRPSGLDVGFDPAVYQSDINDACRVRLMNVNSLLHMELADAGLCPTAWQASTFPGHFRDKISVIHDGIDSEKISPNNTATMDLDGKLCIKRGDPIITFISRNLEPYRGFHTFMRSLPLILRRSPDARVLVIGEDKPGYGPASRSGLSWKSELTREIQSAVSPGDWERVHFLGHIEYPRFISALQVSAVHVYLTYPFVLSWSLLEAMSAGCTVVASDTPPVREVLKDRVNGILTDFFDEEALSTKVTEALSDDMLRSSLGQMARQTIVEHYDLNQKCLPRQISWAKTLGERGCIKM